MAGTDAYDGEGERIFFNAWYRYFYDVIGNLKGREDGG